MQVLLLEKVQNLGDLGDEVTVKNGYARNFLLPQRKALRATDENREVFESRRKELEAAALEKLQGAERRAAQLEDFNVTILAKAGDGNRLYGSVGILEIARTLNELGIEVHKGEVLLAEPIRELGEYEVNIQVHADIVKTITVYVQPD